MAGTHPRNVAGIVEHRRNLGVAATRRVEATLDALERSGARITFPLVATRAGVSRSWLYAQQEFRHRIQRLRREHPWPAHAPAERASNASNEAIIRTLRQRLADEEAAKVKVMQKNKQLRKINEALAGEVYFCRTHHTTNAVMASNYSRIVYHAPPSFESEKTEAH